MEREATIPVEGMSCKHCVRAVANALKAIEGVKKVEVSLEGKNARVVYDDELTRRDILEAAIVEEGYEVKT